MEYSFSLKVYNRRIKNKAGERIETQDGQIVLIAKYLKPFVGRKIEGKVTIPEDQAIT
jgi:hypothetical protein